MGKEIEIKLRAENSTQLLAAFEKIKAEADKAEEQTIAMHTRYFDTAEGELRNRKWTLRTRQENDVNVLTCKTKGENHCRGEWNLKRDTDAAAPTQQELQALVMNGAPELFLSLSSLYVTCEAEFTRRAAMLTMDDGTAIELAADVGVLCGKEEEEVLCEMELELYAGNYDTMLQLAKSTGLSEEPMSKAARAMRLK